MRSKALTLPSFLAGEALRATILGGARKPCRLAYYRPVRFHPYAPKRMHIRPTLSASSAAGEFPRDTSIFCVFRFCASLTQ